MSVNTTSDTALTRRTQDERRASTRAALLTGAISVVVETGPNTSVTEIAGRAGVSKGALQHHFDSKNDLMVAVVAMGWDDLIELSSSLPGESTSPADRVAALVSAMWESYQRPSCRAAFMISSDPNLDRDLRVRLAPSFDDARDRLDLMWRDALANLDVSDECVAHARRFARSHLLGMLVQRQLPSDEPDPTDELSFLCEATVLILLAPGER